MTIEKARQILESEIVDLTDEQVLLLIHEFGSFCDVILDVIVKEHLTAPKEGGYNG